MQYFRSNANLDRFLSAKNENKTFFQPDYIHAFSSIVCCVAPYAFWYQRPSERRIRTQCASYIVPASATAA